MKALLFLLLPVLLFAQMPDEALDVDYYRLVIRNTDPAQTDVNNLNANAYAGGETIIISWSYTPPAVPLPNTFLPSIGDDIVIEVQNEPGLWNTESEAEHTYVVSLDVGFWHIRVKAVGTNALESDWSGRLDFKITGQPARVYIRIE
jgi:hypothetical protein